MTSPYDATFFQDLDGYNSNDVDLAYWETGTVRLWGYRASVNRSGGAIGKSDMYSIQAGDQFWLWYFPQFGIFDIPPGNTVLKVDVTLLFAGGQSHLIDMPNVSTGWNLLQFDLTPWTGDFIQDVHVTTPGIFPTPSDYEYNVLVDNILISNAAPPQPAVNRLWIYKINTRTGEIISRGVKS